MRIARKKFISQRQSKQPPVKLILIFITFFVVITTISLWLIFSPERSTIIARNAWDVELLMRDTVVSVPIFFAEYGDIRSTNIQIQQRANSELRVQFDFDGVVDISIIRGDGIPLGQRTIFFDEEVTILSTGQEDAYTFVITPRIDMVNTNESSALTQRQNLFIVQPYNVRHNILQYVDSNISFRSPSCLQLALFAHMAYFPFDFNAGEKPQYHEFKPFHHEPFYDYVMAYNAWGFNSFGFNFMNEMAGWYLTSVYDDADTDFRVVLYYNENDNKLVLSIRGTYGGLSDALFSQTGAWWCNFRSLSGYRHSQVYSLVSFLNEPSITNKLASADIYITGHSLGGYLTYIATYELVRMGLGDNIRRSVAFSAPTFFITTVEALAGLDSNIRRRMSHFYVHHDLIAGVVGIEKTEPFPDYDAFVLVSRILRNLRDVHDIDVPLALQIISDAIGFVEGITPFAVSADIRELLWIVNGSFSAEAIALTAEFDSLIWHETVAHTWRSPRDTPDIPLVPSILENLIMDLVFDMLDRVFNTDTHFMMNFYSHLATQAITK